MTRALQEIFFKLFKIHSLLFFDDKFVDWKKIGKQIDWIQQISFNWILIERKIIDLRGRGYFRGRRRKPSKIDFEAVANHQKLSNRKN